MISCLPGPLLTIFTGTPSSFSINSMYLRQFSGSLSYSLIPRISSFHPGSTSYTGFAFLSFAVTGKSFTTSPSISYHTHTGISSKYPSTSNTVSATSVAPCILTP